MNYTNTDAEKEIEMIFIARSPDEEAEVATLNERYINFKNNNIEANNFIALRARETAKSRDAYLEAKKAYARTLKNFIVTYVKNKEDFEKNFWDTHLQVCERFCYECGDLNIDDLMTLEWMLDEHQHSIDEGRFYELINEGYCES